MFTLAKQNTRKKRTLSSTQLRKRDKTEAPPVVSRWVIAKIESIFSPSCKATIWTHYSISTPVSSRPFFQTTSWRCPSFQSTGWSESEIRKVAKVRREAYSCLANGTTCSIDARWTNRRSSAPKTLKYQQSKIANKKQMSWCRSVELTHPKKIPLEFWWFPSDYPARAGFVLWEDPAILETLSHL